MNKYLVVVSSIVLIVFYRTFGFSKASAQEGEQAQHDQIDSYLESLVEYGFSGAVLVAKDGEIILEEGYGLANDADQLPVTSNTVFLFGSITKQFTAAAILHLEMYGLLSTNDRISEYFDAVPVDKADITIHQLLTHSSGLRNHVFSNDFQDIARDEAVKQILEPELLFDPGTGVSYSDDAFKVLAAIVEIISGQSWQAYLQEHLFTPAGMEHTGFFNDPKWENLRIANGYYSGWDKGSPKDWPGPYWALIGGGGVMTTVGDMYRWYLALRDQTILSATALEKLWTPFERIGGRSSFGYGWIVVETEDQGVYIETTGAGTSHNAYFHSSLNDDLVVIVASNRIDEPLLATLGLAEPDENFYSVQVGDALVENISSGDFGTTPEFTRPRERPLHLTTLGYAVLGVIVVVFLVGIWVVLRRRS